MIEREDVVSNLLAAVVGRITTVQSPQELYVVSGHEHDVIPSVERLERRARRRLAS